MILLALAGWAAAATAALRAFAFARRIELVADAEHELRGPLTALGLAADAGAPASAVATELERARTALADLEAARAGRRAEPRPATVPLRELVAGAGAAWLPAARRVTLDWRAGAAAVRADRGRLAQAFGNLLANAVEHGGGEVRLRGRRTPTGVLVEVADSGRGRGLAIAARAVEEAGGSLRLTRGESGATVAVELPAAEA
jgi:signal transduction histidine kinase